MKFWFIFFNARLHPDANGDADGVLLAQLVDLHVRCLADCCISVRQVCMIIKKLLLKTYCPAFSINGYIFFEGQFCSSWQYAVWVTLRTLTVTS